MEVRYFAPNAINFSYHIYLLIVYVIWRYMFAESFWSSITTQQAFITAYLVYFCYFWIFATPYLLLTYFKKPKSIYFKYKIQLPLATEIEHKNVDNSLSLMRCIRVVLFNQIFGTTPVIYCYYKYFSYYYSIDDYHVLPSMLVSILYILLFMTMYEMVFYPIHYLFHLIVLPFQYHKL
eukprot:208905_1